MAFKFDWNKLKQSDFETRLKLKLNETILSALSRRDGPVSVVAQANGVDLGQVKPSLQLLEVHDLNNDRMSLSFAMAYRGDAKVGITWYKGRKRSLFSYPPPQ